MYVCRLVLVFHIRAKRTCVCVLGFAAHVLNSLSCVNDRNQYITNNKCKCVSLTCRWQSVLLRADGGGCGVTSVNCSVCMPMLRMYDFMTNLATHAARGSASAYKPYDPASHCKHAFAIDDRRYDMLMFMLLYSVNQPSNETYSLLIHIHATCHTHMLYALAFVCCVALCSTL